MLLRDGKGYVLYSPNCQDSGKDKTLGTVERKISGCQGLGGGVNRWGTGFLGHTTVYDTVMVGTCHYIFVHSHRRHPTKSDP